MKKSAAILFASLPAAVLLMQVAAFPAGGLPGAVRNVVPGTANRGSLEVNFDTSAGGVTLSAGELGEILVEGEIVAFRGAKRLSSAGEDLARVTAAGEQPGFVMVFSEGTRVYLELEDADTLGIRAEGAAGEKESRRAPSLAVSFALPRGVDAFPALLKGEEDRDRKVLATLLGPAELPRARALFEPKQDLALHAEVTGGDVRWRRAGGTWKLSASVPPGGALKVRLRRDYFKDELGVTFYRPLEKKSFWKTAPVVAMTWYGVCGMKRPQDLDLLKPEIDWVAGHLLPFAERLVFQLDDNYPFADDGAMRAFSGAVRAKGLIPGIWLTPFSTVPPAEVKPLFAAHPERFLRDKEGRPLSGFGGVNWGGPAGGGSTCIVDVRDPGARKENFAPFIRRARETWGFDFFKIDGQPRVIAAYREAAGEEGVTVYRDGLRLIRKLVGEDRFVNGCWGIPMEGAGIMNGSRTGGDTGYRPHAVDVILRWEFLNNYVWWCDPDAAAVLFDKPKALARLNAQARCLTGQQFLTDDFWTKVPGGIMRIWQRSFPNLDIRPANLYPVAEGWESYDLFDLRMAGPFGTRDVAGLFNYGDRVRDVPLDLSRLPIESERVHLFEYWSSEYLGVFPRDAVLVRRMEPCSGEVFAVVPDRKDEPRLVSTSRHVSQGGLDLEDLEWRAEGEKRIAAGVSSHLVAQDPYTLVFARGRYDLLEARVIEGGAKSEDAAGASPLSVEIATDEEGATSRVTVTPASSGSLRWRVVFAPAETPAVAPRIVRLDLEPGGPRRLELVNMGSKPAKWRVASSDPRIEAAPSAGELGPWPAAAAVEVAARAGGLPAGSLRTGRLTVASGGVRRAVTVNLHVPPPPNLALEAAARASSLWSEDYGAGRVNDGKRATRWNAKKGEKNGSWVELLWPEPVTVKRVVIDECTDFGPRIRAWRLEAAAGDGSPAVVVARGGGCGRGRVVDLAGPLETRRLRLVVESAVETPTIREFEVYP